MGDSKIVEGCTAIVLPSDHHETSQNSGKIVKVGKYLGLKPDFGDGVYWEVDLAMIYDSEEEYYFSEEDRLERLDDTKETTIIKQETIKTN